MMRANSTTRCSRLREWLTDSMIDRLDIADRMRRHIEHCPTCRRRALRNARVGLAFRLVKTQPHSMGLLLEANRRAIAMLKRDVRELPQANRLRTELPRAPWRVRVSGFAQSAAAAAACVVVLLAARVGILSSLDRAQNEGRQAMEHYCSILDKAGAGHDST